MKQLLFVLILLAVTNSLALLKHKEDSDVSESFTVTFLKDEVQDKNHCKE